MAKHVANRRLSTRHSELQEFKKEFLNSWKPKKTTSLFGEITYDPSRVKWLINRVETLEYGIFKNLEMIEQLLRSNDAGEFVSPESLRRIMVGLRHLALGPEHEED